MKRKFGLNRHSKTPQAKAMAKLDKSLSVLVRTHYEPMGCFTCPTVRPYKIMDCGHFRRRELKATRFDLRNVGNQCPKCNRFDGGRPYEFARKLDEIWGEGTANEMFEKSREIKQWEVVDLELLNDAVKKGWLVYLQVYEDLEKAREKIKKNLTNLKENLKK